MSSLSSMDDGMEGEESAALGSATTPAPLAGGGGGSGCGGCDAMGSAIDAAVDDSTLVIPSKASAATTGSTGAPPSSWVYLSKDVRSTATTTLIKTNCQQNDVHRSNQVSEVAASATAACETHTTHSTYERHRIADIPTHPTPPTGRMRVKWRANE